MLFMALPGERLANERRLIVNPYLSSLKGRVVVALVVLAVAVAPVAEATNGYLIHGIGTKTKGMAGAGIALPQDALIAGTNPAGLAFVGKRNDLGVAVFNPNRSYTVNGNPSGPPPQFFGLVPGTVDSDSEYFVVPNFGLNRELNANSRLGLAVYGQGGMNTDYPTATFYGTSPTGVNLSQLFIVPSWAMKDGSGTHAFGVSAIVAYQQFEIEGLQAFGGFSTNPAALTNNGADDAIGYGARVGYMGRYGAFSFGLTYQTEISMEEFDDYAGLFAEQGGFDIPSNLGVGLAAGLTEKITAALDVQQIYYSDIGSVGNPMANLFDPTGAGALGAANGAGFGWDDMTVVKLGFLFETDGDWTWRAGFSTGDQPIPPSEVMFNILAPGVVEEHITLGFTRALGNNRQLNFALMHAPSVTVSGPNPLDPGQTIDLEMDQWDIEIGFSWGM